MALENVVKEALNALYHHPDDAVRSQADQWLQKFQRTIDAWQISLAVAALAVQVPPEDWADGGIMKWLRDEMSSHPDIVPSFLELLRVLPELLPFRCGSHQQTHIYAKDS